MSLSAGSTIALASSGSRSSISSIEPLMSANNAVTVLRSPSNASEVSDCSPTTRTPDADSGDGGVRPPVLATLVSGAPHLPQKFDVGGFSAQHLAQSLASAFPQCVQKLFTGGLFVPQFEHRISLSCRRHSLSRTSGNC